MQIFFFRPCVFPGQFLTRFATLFLLRKICGDRFEVGRVKRTRRIGGGINQAIIIKEWGGEKGKTHWSKKKKRHKWQHFSLLFFDSLLTSGCCTERGGGGGGKGLSFTYGQKQKQSRRKRKRRRKRKIDYAAAEKSIYLRQSGGKEVEEEEGRGSFIKITRRGGRPKKVICSGRTLARNSPILPQESCK